MKQLFTINSDATVANLKDAIHGTLKKTKAILTCIMFSTEFIRDGLELDEHTLYHALWAADDYLDDLQLLLNRLERLV